MSKLSMYSKLMPWLSAAPGWRAVTAVLCVAVIAVACGGGGGSTTTTVADSGFVNTDPVDLSSYGGDVGGGDSSGDSGADGSAGDGGAMRKAAVVLTCSNSATQFSATTDDAGKYLIRFNRSNCQSPYIVRVVDVGGNTYASIGTDTPVSGKVVRVNITPLTDKVVSDVVQPFFGATSQNFTAQSLTAVLSGTTLTNVITTAKANLRISISDALVASGITSVSTFDPVLSTHAFNGTGVDAVLESIGHTRDPQSGRTILSAKLVSVGSGVTPTVAEITAATPLPVAQLNIPSSPGLNFSKLNAWVNQINACLASVPGSVNNCENNVISDTYKHSSKDFEEDFKSLISGTSCGVASSPCHIEGSALRNTVLLFTGKYAGSTAAYDDLAVVEVTISQPSVGSYYGTSSAVATPVEYTKILTFKRDDSLTGLTASNWVLHGNQRNFDISVSPRYDKYTQLNAARDSNAMPAVTTTVFNASVAGNPFTTTLASGITYSVVVGTGTQVFSTQNLNDPSVYSSSIRLFVNPTKFNTTTRAWDSANIRTVKVTGLGLPAAGLVMMANSANVCGGDDYLSIANATGTIPAGTGTLANNSGYTSNAYTLGSVLQSNTGQEVWYMGQAPRANRRLGNLADYSGLLAYNLYQFDITTVSGATATEYSRTLSAVNPPAALATAQWNDISPSNSLLNTAALAATANNYTMQWLNNQLAAYVNQVQIFSSAATSSAAFARFNYNANVTGGVAVARPTSQFIAYPSDVLCASGGVYPAIVSTGENRQFALRSYQGRADMYNRIAYTK